MYRLLSFLFLSVIFSIFAVNTAQASFIQCQFTTCSGIVGFPENYGECVNGSASANCEFDGFCNLTGQTYCQIPNFGNFYCGEQNEVVCFPPPEPTPTPTPPPPPPQGSLYVSTNNGGVSWCIDHGVGCDSGTFASYAPLPFNTYTISYASPGGYSCSVDANSRQINSVNPDKGFNITCTANTPPPSVDLRCNTLNSCTIAFNGTANLSWTTSNASSCTASSNPTGGWSGSRGTSGSEAKLNQIVTRTYTLSCSGPGGSGNDSVVVTVPANSRPLATNIRLTEPDYCSFGPGGTISWTYSDPDGDTQGAYQVQVDTNSAFNSPDYDSGKVLSTSNSASIPSGVLTWANNYRARVLVWDTHDLQCLDWVAMSQCVGPGCAANQQTWTTPQHQYPSNINTFSWAPTRPPINQLVEFSRGLTQCYQNPPNTVTACASYDWLFGDGTGSSIASPSHAYTTTGTYDVTLTAVEQQAGYSCSVTKQITVQPPIPNWKEVFPR